MHQEGKRETQKTDLDIGVRSKKSEKACIQGDRFTCCERCRPAHETFFRWKKIVKKEKIERPSAIERLWRGCE